MVAINLLPWRDWQVIYQRRAILLAFGTVSTVVICLLILIHCWIKWQEKNYRAIINEHFKTSAMMAALPDIQRLRRESDFFRRLITVLNQFNQQGICFLSLEKRDHDFFLQGEATSTAHLTAYLQHTSLAELFFEIQLTHLHEKTSDGVVFELRGVR